MNIKMGLLGLLNKLTCTKQHHTANNLNIGNKAMSSKKAFLVGINKYKSAKLRGCVNDVTSMREVLLDLYGFQPDNIKMLLDRDATKAAMIDGIQWLAEDNNDESVRVFHFAGHGHFVPDENGDEPDGTDETLVPVDYTANDFLIDDKLKELYDTFSKKSNLTLIMDCCHSGSNQRGDISDITHRFLPSSYEDKKAIRSAREKFNHAKREFVLERIEKIRDRDVPRDEFREEVLGFMQEFEKQRFGDHRLREGNILLAGCQSDQTSADAKMSGDYHGAFTYHLAKVIRDAHGSITHHELIEQIGDALHNDEFQQIPQLECDPGREKLKLFSSF